MKRQLRYLLVVVVFIVSININAQVELAKIFTDNMVLQQNQKVKIWGTAEAGEVVTIKASWNKTVSTIANEMGINILEQK